VREHEDFMTLPARFRRLATLVVVLVCATSAAARADKVDDHVRAEMARSKVPSVSLAVIRNGQLVKIQGYGLADVERQVSATPDTVYKIGSVSKQFIATGIMMLVQDGRLSLEDPVSKHLQGTPASWTGITIRHLLTHTSGLVREGPAFDPFKIQSDADVVRSAYPLPLRFEPGTKWEYCNTGYFALADIIRTVSGQPWSDYLNAKVFQPSGMTSTRPTSATDPMRAVGYAGEDNRDVAPDWPAVRPSGAFLSTVRDLVKWEGVLATNQILTDESRRLMWTAVRLNDGSSYPYGFGWELGERAGRRHIGHGGSLPGFRATYARFPDEGLTVIVLTNADQVDRAAIVKGIADIYLQVEATVPTRN
jgi:D-alanyl-D-alanine carboxypeptidase